MKRLWFCIKRLSNNFLGLNFNLLSELENKGIQPKDYIDHWLCYCLIMKEVERKKLNEYEIQDYFFCLLVNN